MNRKKLMILTLGLFLGIGSAIAGMSCSCTKGKMTVVIADDGKISMKCSGGGQVRCVEKLK